MTPPTFPSHRSPPAFRKTTLALFAAGFSTFALMYCVQPLLPELAAEFGVSAATSSLAVSLTTGALAVTLLLGGAASETVARKTMIVSSLAATALLTVACAAAPSWTSFLILRALAGVAFAGLPAIAMAYVGEEIALSAVGLAMGIYVAGTAVGGMVGRVLASILTEEYGWRVAVGAAGGFGLGAAALVALLLPPARHVRADLSATGGAIAGYRAILLEPQLRALFGLGFLYMGVFVAVYNYLTFRLVEPPYELGHTAIGAVFLLYLVGMVSSPWAGALAGTTGRRRTVAFSLTLMALGVTVTLLRSLGGIIVGVGLLTFGFFAAHSVTSTWIGVLAGHRRAQASSLYIVFYYVGASVTGTVGGVFWSHYGWPGVALLTLAQTLAALALVRTLRANEFSAT